MIEKNNEKRNQEKNLDFDPTMGGSPPTGSNFLWVGLTANEHSHHQQVALTNKSSNRRPKNHDRLLTSANNSSNQNKIKNRRHSAPPGSFEHFLKNGKISTTLSKSQKPPITAQTPNRRKSATTASAMTNRSSGKPAAGTNNLGQKNITKSMIRQKHSVKNLKNVCCSDFT